jgi:hypothetical protein
MAAYTSGRTRTLFVAVKMPLTAEASLEPPLAETSPPEAIPIVDHKMRMKGTLTSPAVNISLFQ